MGMSIRGARGCACRGGLLVNAGMRTDKALPLCVPGCKGRSMHTVGEHWGTVSLLQDGRCKATASVQLDLSSDLVATSEDCVAI